MLHSDIGLYGISVLVTTAVLNLKRYYIFCLVIRNTEYRLTL